MAHDVAEVVEMPVRRFERVPPKARLLSLGLILLGILAFAAALMSDATRAWRAYMYNWLFWTSLAQGAVMLAAVVTIVKGGWARPVRRIAISFVAFLPLAFLLMLPLFFVGEHLFPWIGEDLHGKEVWLNVPFLAARNILALGILFALSLAFAYWSVRPDAGRQIDSVPDRLRGWYKRLTRHWRGEAEEDARAARHLGWLAPVLALAYAGAMTVMVFDFSMSLEPEWLSTLYGGYFFMGAFYGGVALTTLAVVLYRRALDVEHIIGGPTLHDLGKLTFALSILWAYLFWAQFIVIWYGLLPEEQEFVIHRFASPFGGIALAIFLMLWVIPFFGMLGAKPKRTPATLILFPTIILVGLWLERYLLVYPSYYHDTAAAPFGLPEIGAGLIFAGLFLASILYFARRFPMIQLWEPLSEAQLLGTIEEPPGRGVPATE